MTITSVTNGWIVKYDCDPDEQEAHRTEVFQYDDEEEGSDIKTFAYMLRRITDIYAPSTSRYSQHRVHTVVAPGDKYEGYREDKAEEDMDLFETPDDNESGAV